ncbi:MAG: hypothetical protein ABIT96_03965 [Ferruginibacter sp.]
MNPLSNSNTNLSPILDDIFIYLGVNSTQYKMVKDMDPARSLNYDDIHRIETELEESGLTMVKEVDYHKQFRLNSRGIQEMAKHKTYSHYLKSVNGKTRTVSFSTKSLSPLLTILISVVLSAAVSFLIMYLYTSPQADTQYDTDKIQNGAILYNKKILQQQNNAIREMMQRMDQVQSGR